MNRMKLFMAIIMPLLALAVPASSQSEIDTLHGDLLLPSAGPAPAEHHRWIEFGGGMLVYGPDCSGLNAGFNAVEQHYSRTPYGVPPHPKPFGVETAVLTTGTITVHLSDDYWVEVLAAPDDMNLTHTGDMLSTDFSLKLGLFSASLNKKFQTGLFQPFVSVGWARMYFRLTQPYGAKIGLSPDGDDIILEDVTAQGVSTGFTGSVGATLDFGRNEPGVRFSISQFLMTQQSITFDATPADISLSSLSATIELLIPLF